MKEIREKKLAYTEYAYFFGIFFLSLSSALLAKSGMGVSLASAPAYVLWVKASLTQNVSFGTAEYTFQAFVLITLFAIRGRPKKAYLFSFASTLIYAFTLDAMMNLLDFIPLNMYVRIAYVIIASVIGPLSIALMSHTYITPYSYTFFINEVNDKFNVDSKAIFWALYSLSGLIGVGLSFYFFGPGRFVGASVGSLVYTLASIFLLRPWEKIIEKRFRFRDKYKQLKRHFK
jgi:uncharacterized membrane protein YczE